MNNLVIKNENDASKANELLTQYLQKYKTENNSDSQSSNSTNSQDGNNIDVVVKNLLNITENALNSHIDYLQERTEKTDYISELSKSIDRVRNVLQRMRYMQHVISNNINVTSATEQLLEKNYYSILEKYDVNSESPKLVSDLKNLFFPKKFMESLNINPNISISRNTTTEAAKPENITQTKQESGLSQLSIDSTMLKNLITGAGFKQSQQSESTENLIERPVDLSSIQFLEMKDKVKKSIVPNSIAIANPRLIHHLKMKIESENLPSELDAQEKLLDQQLIQGATGGVPHK